MIIRHLSVLFMLCLPAVAQTTTKDTTYKEEVGTTTRDMESNDRGETGTVLGNNISHPGQNNNQLRSPSSTRSERSGKVETKTSSKEQGDVDSKNENGRLKAENKRLIGEHDQDQNEIKDLKSEINVLKGNIASLSSQRENDKNEIQAEKDKLASKSNELNKYIGRNGELESANKQLAKDKEKLDGVIKKLNETNDALTAKDGKMKYDLDKAENKSSRLERTVLGWQRATSLLGILLVIVISIAVIIIHHYSRSNHNISHGRLCQAIRDFTGTIRPSFDEHLPRLQDWLLHLTKDTPWDDSWADMVRMAVAGATSRGRTGEDEATLFLTCFWIPFVARFDPDDTNWKWLQEQVSRVCPSKWTIEILDSVKPGSTLITDDRIARIHGQGNTIKHVLAPAVSICDLEGKRIGLHGAHVEVE